MTNRQVMVPKQPEAAQLQEDLEQGRQGPFKRQEGNECGFTTAISMLVIQRVPLKPEMVFVLRQPLPDLPSLLLLRGREVQKLSVE